MTYAREDVARACLDWGVHLWVPAGIHGPQLMWAIAGCESSFGANAAPRHEPAYDVGGRYADNPQQAKLLREFGSNAACSYGPWQEMLVNVQPPASPEEMLRVNRCAMAHVGYLNTRILKAQHAQTVEEIAAAYNSGKWMWEQEPVGVQRYAAECRQYYDGVPLPQVA